MSPAAEGSSADGCEPEELTAMEEVGLPPDDGSGDGWFDDAQLNGMPLCYDPDS